MSAKLDAFIDIINQLYEPDTGCPWTQEQTHQSLAPYLIEEAYETVATIDNNDEDSLQDELGDLLLQIVLHAAIAERQGKFNFDDVAQTITDKLIRRYPTILGDEPNTLRTAEEIDHRWQQIKTEERAAKGINPKDESILDGITPALPSLLRAAKLKGRAAHHGWEWSDKQMMIDKIAEEIGELQEELDQGGSKTRVAAELGDLLFMMVDFGRINGIDAEDALRTTCDRFEKRFRYMETGLKSEGHDIETSERENRRAWWDKAKQAEKQSTG